MNDLGTLGGDSRAFSINAGGRVVGWSYLDGDEVYRAFLWTSAEGMIDLGTLGGTTSEARAINIRGTVVGASGDGGVGNRAFIWSHGTMSNLNELIPSGIGWELRWAYDINDAEQIVGFGYLDGEQRAYLLTPDCNGKEIPDADDVASGTSEDVDANGQPDECQPTIVYAQALEGQTRPFSG